MRQKRKTAVKISFTAVYYLSLSDINHQLLYLYEIKNGKMIKQPKSKKNIKKYKNTFVPIQFLSDKKILLNNNKVDSLYIFLIIDNDNKLLKNKLKISYSYYDNNN